MNFSEQLRARWAALAMRERQMVGGAIALVALALLWWIALAPALRTLAAAPAEHAQLDAQLQQMATLQNRPGSPATMRCAPSRPRCAKASASTTHNS